MAGTSESIVERLNFAIAERQSLAESIQIIQEEISQLSAMACGFSIGEYAILVDDREAKCMNSGAKRGMKVRIDRACWADRAKEPRLCVALPHPNKGSCWVKASSLEKINA